MYINGKRVELRGAITYRKAFDDSLREVQPAHRGPYRGYVCDLKTHCVQVRADGWLGSAPLLTVFSADIRSVES